MFARALRRPLAAGAASAIAVAVGVIGMGTAQAANIGTLSVSPVTGLDSSSVVVTSSGPCTDPNATNLIATVTGAGFNAGTNTVVANTAISAFQTSQNGGYIVPLGQTMQTFASRQSPPATLTGRYDFTLTCRTAFNGASLGDFTGSIWFTDATHYQNVDPAASSPTTTALAASPASPQQQGSTVTFTATVSPTGYAGTVQFKDGSNALGSPQPVNTTTGVATLATSSLSVGTHSITATFTPAISGLAPSTSSATSYTIQPAPATSTTTALLVSPSSANNLDNVTLTATVSPSNGVGSITFADGGATLSTVQLVNGSASLTKTYAAGQHLFTASFVPTDTSAFTPSSSTSTPYTVTQFAGASTSETLQTTVAAGSLSISVPTNPTVLLPTPVLAPSGDKFTTSGAINTVEVTDTRAGNPGWNVTGQVSDFSGPAGTSINGANLGWTPAVKDKLPAQTVTAGAAVPPAAAIAPGAPAPSGFGLSSARQLASAAAGAGNGTAHLDAALALSVPTSTPAGTYTATLTLTAI